MCTYIYRDRGWFQALGWSQAILENQYHDGVVVPSSAGWADGRCERWTWVVLKRELEYHVHSGKLI